MTAMKLHRYPSPSGGIALGKMGVGATMLKQGKTARDYVQDGLIAMWDGIENAGWGVHDASATTWKDLSGNNNNLSVDSECIFDENGLRTWDVRKGKCYALANTGLDCVSAEFVCERIESYGMVSFFGAGNGKLFMFGSQYVQFANPYEETLDNTVPSKASLSCVYGTGSSVSVMCNGQQMTRRSQTNNWSYASIAMNFGLGGGSRYSAYQMLGRINCVRLYSRALTADEIAANYAIDKERFNLP